MSNKQALLDCTFSWGKTCRLYGDSIEIAGKSYNLDELTSIHPTYRTWFGITSARLELCFGPRRLTLRGIPNAEIARQIVSHLLPYTEQANPQSSSPQTYARPKKTRDLTRVQAQTWERTKELPMLPDVQPQNPSAKPAATTLTPETDETTYRDQSLSQSEEDTDIFDDFLDIAEQLPAHTHTNTLPAPVQSVVAERSTQQATLPMLLLPAKPAEHALTDQFSLLTQTSLLMLAEASPAQPMKQIPTHNTSQPLLHTKIRPRLIPRREPPLRAVQLVNTFSSPGQTLSHVANKSISDSNELGTSSVHSPTRKSSVLPVIHVPVRLQPGECAHYSIGAALCSDTLTSSTYADHPPLDQGLLILTNRRVFYLGKHCQLILAYTHLWYVSRLPNAVALHIEGQFRRIMMEIEHSQEWASRIEQLAFIARRSPVRSTPTAPTFVLPGIRPASALPITIKRAALELPNFHTDANPKTTYLSLLDQPTVESAPQAYQSLIETPTIIVRQSIEEMATHEFALLADLDTVKIQTQAHVSEAEAEEVTHKIVTHTTRLNAPADAQHDLDEEATDKIEAVRKKR